MTGTIRKKQSFLSWFREMWTTHPLFSTGIALIVMVVLQTLALGFQFDSFGAWLITWVHNWLNILRNNAGIGIIALGMTFVIISGGIDLAVGSTLVAIGAVVMVLIDGNAQGLLLSMGITGVPAFLLAIVVGVAFGDAARGAQRRPGDKRQAAALHRHARHHEDLPQRHPALHAGPHALRAEGLPADREL